MVDAQETASKFFSKTSRWRSKISEKLDKEDHAASPPPSKPVRKAQDPDDLSDFLKPSTDRAQQHKDAATAAFLSNRPKIDVARAQRWPGAQEILASAAAGGKSPGPGGLKTGTRKKGMTVGFVRTVPEIIGHGGDECEDPSIEVSRRKKANMAPPLEADNAQSQQRPQDDTNLGANIGRTASQTEQRNSLTRTLTSHGETSPPLEQKMRMGHINSYAQPPPPPPQRMGPMGLGDRPRPLSRAPTGFDGIPEPSARRPSNDSAYSQDSDNSSPVLPRRLPQLEPTIREEENFKPKPLGRTQTGFTQVGVDASNGQPPPMPAMPPRLPEMRMVAQEDDSPLDGNAMLAEKFLKSESAEPDSFAARVKQRMRAEEGRALHEAAQRAASGERRDSDSSSMNSTDPFQVGTPPSSYSTSQMARSPPQGGPYEPTRSSPMRGLDPEDPQRSRARGPSPRRGPPPQGVLALNTDPGPPSSGPQARASPAMRSESAAVGSATVSRNSSVKEYIPYSAVSQQSNLPTPLQYEQKPPPLQSQLSAQSQLPMNAVDPLLPIGGLSRQSSVKPATENGNRQNASLVRSDTKLQNEAAFKDFADRVTHMRGIFQLTAQLGGNVSSHSPLEWLRCATWWFLRGRAGMENLIRSQPRTGEPPQERLTQPHVDLAKVAWILTDILPNHPGLKRYGGQSPEAEGDLARQAGDAASAEVYEIQTAIFHYMKLLVGSMKKHQSMPPTAALIQGQDQGIWEEYPSFTPDAASVLTSGATRADASSAGPNPPFRLSQYIPLADTKNEFCYFRMFSKASIATDDPNTDRVPMSTVVSVLRHKDAFQVKLAICSQNSLINIMVGGNSAITWKDVNWNRQARKISIQLRHGFVLSIELSEGDMRSLFSIVDHTNRVDSDLRERRDERFACKLYLREAAFKDSANPNAFPPERVPGCKLMVFQRIERSSEGTGKRKLHRGYRMVLVTATQTKQVSLVNQEVGTKQEAMNFEYVTEADQAPALRLHFRDETQDKKPKMCTAHLVFQDSKDRNHLFGTFTSMNVAEGEMTFASVPLKAFHIESADQAEGFSQRGSRTLEKLQWQDAKVMNLDPEIAGLEAAPTVMSESLRIVCRHTAGILSDRMNLGSGELLVRLPIDGSAELTLLREPQQDLAVAIDGSRSERDVPDALAELLRTLSSASTIRRLTFNSFQDLHSFQFAVTGFSVKFDGIASTFSISRRRMVVPIYKQWTANTIRLQVVQQDNILQLLAFFEDFSHADAMNFQLRTTDSFEKTDKGGKFGLKLVDAKFALPVEERRGEGKMQKEEGRLTGWSGTKRRFVCLDEIEYPGEHDDILIQFDSAETRDRFAEALPAATMSRKFTVRRKI